MKNLLLIFGISALIAMSGCKKDSPSGPDNTSTWVGIYNVPNQAGSSGVTQIQIVKASDNTLRVILKQEQFNYLYTATTLQNVTISGNTATINETQNIIEQTDLGPYVFNGTIILSGNTAILSTTAVSIKNPNNAEVSPLNFSFNGPKVR